MQSQQQEMNEFTEEERRNLEVTVCEMENQVINSFIYTLCDQHLLKVPKETTQMFPIASFGGCNFQVAKMCTDHLWATLLCRDFCSAKH